MFLIPALLIRNILNKKGFVMKFFIELLVSFLVVGAIYYFFNVPYSSFVDMQYTKGYDNGGK